MNIFLCGFMGSGKSTVGKALSAELNYDFVDLDDKIETENKMSINEIFKNFSEEYFRNLETKTLKNVCKSDKQVISLGGGTAIKQENVDIIKSSGILIYLEVNENTVFNRLKDDNTRPLLNVDDKLSVIKEMMSKRTPVYQKNADFIVNGNQNAEKITDFIKKIVKK